MIGEKIVVWVGKVLSRTRRRVQRVMVEMVRATREERMRIMGSVMVMRTRGTDGEEGEDVRGGNESVDEGVDEEEDGKVRVHGGGGLCHDS